MMDVAAGYTDAIVSLGNSLFRTTMATCNIMHAGLTLSTPIQQQKVNGVEQTLSTILSL